jgi:ACS family tartrate transporter-like MFS transporter
MSITPDPGVLRKAAWRLLPFLCLLYILNILNRTNVGFAALTMRQELGIREEAFDLAYGIFYFGYLAFQLPANLLLPYVGARRWIALLLVFWGLVSIATLSVTGPISLDLMRILLGIAQAGFFPGIILYLTYWFPNRERARVIALFMMANAIAGVVGNPIHGAIMKEFKGSAGLSGWQWLFLLEGIPTVLMGAVVLFYLPNSPAQASWLKEDERDWLRQRLEPEEQARRQAHGGNLSRALRDVRVWQLIAVYFTVAVAANAFGGYLPRLLKDRFGEDELTIGLLGALPNLCAVAGMILISRNSDRTGSRRGHVCFTALLGTAGWLLAWAADSGWVALVGLCLAQTGMLSMLPCFWAIPTAFLGGTAAAGGIALINSVGNIGGALGANILGKFGLQSMAIILAIGSVLVLTVRGEEGNRG